MKKEISRRVFLKNSISASVAAAAISAGLLSPKQVLAAWPKDAFEAEKVEDALKSLTGSAESTRNIESIRMKAPTVVLIKDSYSIPVTVSSSLNDVDLIALFVPSHPNPLVATLRAGGNTAPYLSARIRMDKSGELVAVVRSDGKLYSNSVKVSLIVSTAG